MLDKLVYQFNGLYIIWDVNEVDVVVTVNDYIIVG